MVAGACALAAFIVFLYFSGDQSAPQGPAGMVGRPASDFTVSDIDGRPAALADFHGKTIVLNLWASWCPPCRAEMPDLQRLYARFASSGVVVVGVDQGESAATIRSYSQSLGIHYPLWVDQEQKYGRVYEAIGMPTTTIVAPNGTIVKTFDGPLSFDQMVGAVAPYVRRR